MKSVIRDNENNAVVVIETVGEYIAIRTDGLLTLTEVSQLIKDLRLAREELTA